MSSFLEPSFFGLTGWNNWKCVSRKVKWLWYLGSIQVWMQAHRAAHFITFMISRGKEARGVTHMMPATTKDLKISSPLFLSTRRREEFKSPGRESTCHSLGLEVLLVYPLWHSFLLLRFLIDTSGWSTCEVRKNLRSLWLFKYQVQHLVRNHGAWRDIQDFSFNTQKRKHRQKKDPNGCLCVSGGSPKWVFPQVWVIFQLVGWAPHRDQSNLLSGVICDAKVSHSTSDSHHVQTWPISLSPTSWSFEAGSVCNDDCYENYSQVSHAPNLSSQPQNSHKFCSCVSAIIVCTKTRTDAAVVLRQVLRPINAERRNPTSRPIWV